jgi:hypothetical protein
MARIITKELALKIVKKLEATKIDSRSKAHDEYAVVHEGVHLGIISIRRGSEKDKDHDYIPRELHISPNQAKKLAQCPWKREDFIQCLREKELLPPEEGAEEQEDESGAG